MILLKQLKIYGGLCRSVVNELPRRRKKQKRLRKKQQNNKNDKKKNRGKK
jgi:hypothetical protein